MEIMFQKSESTYMRTLVAQIKSQELTQELRIPDSMPDIGRVLGCWGQIVIRSKEWKHNGVNVSGGVLIWCLYSPEDGTELRCSDTWIPFQETWDFQESARDGTIYASARLKALDARCISARKMMIRCNVSIYGEAMEKGTTAVYNPPGALKDVELLCNSYPLEVPCEAGEKTIQLEEVLTVTSGKPAIKRIVCGKTDIEILENRLMTNKLVFRGNAHLSVVYLDEAENMQSCEWTLPFSQLADLDKEYESEITAWIAPILTGQDLDLTEDGQVQYKSGIAAQYVIYDRKLITAVEDAYSNCRELTLKTEEIKIPVRLDVCHEQTELQCPLNDNCAKALNTECLFSIQNMGAKDNEIYLDINGQFQFVYQNENNDVQGIQIRENSEILVKSDGSNRVRAELSQMNIAKVENTPSGSVLTQTVEAEIEVLKEQTFIVISGLEINDADLIDMDRPSAIVMRAGERRLWDIAKECRSTVELIKVANELELEEVSSDRVLLIPVR